MFALSSASVCHRLLGVLVTFTGTSGGCVLVVSPTRIDVIVVAVTAVTAHTKSIHAQHGRPGAKQPPNRIAARSSSNDCKDDNGDKTCQHHKPHHLGIVTPCTIIVSMIVHKVSIN